MKIAYSFLVVFCAVWQQSAADSDEHHGSNHAYIKVPHRIRQIYEDFDNRDGSDLDLQHNQGHYGLNGLLGDELALLWKLTSRGRGGTLSNLGFGGRQEHYHRHNHGNRKEHKRDHAAETAALAALIASLKDDKDHHHHEHDHDNDNTTIHVNIPQYPNQYPYPYYQQQIQKDNDTIHVNVPQYPYPYPYPYPYSYPFYQQQIHYTSPPQPAIQYFSPPQYVSQPQPAVQYVSQPQPSVQYVSQPHPTVQYVSQPRFNYHSVPGYRGSSVVYGGGDQVQSGYPADYAPYNAGQYVSGEAQVQGSPDEITSNTGSYSGVAVGSGETVGAPGAPNSEEADGKPGAGPPGGS